MMNWQGPKRTALLVGAIALAILIGTGVVAAAQGHLAPLTSGNSTQAAAHGDQEPTETGQPEPGEDTTLIGTIQSIDTTGQTFVLAPDDGSAAVTIAFDANTRANDEEDGNNEGNPFVVGAHVRVEVVKRADGSLYAKEVEFVQDEQQEPGEDTTLIGTIQSIDTTGQTFVLAPDDGSAAVTIAFDARTNIDREDGDNGGNPFVVGAHVRVEVVKRADGSLYAREIKLDKSGQGDGDGNGQDGGSGDGNDGGSSGHDGSGSGGSGDNGSGS